MALAEHVSTIKMEIGLLENVLTVSSREEALRCSVLPAADSWPRILSAEQGPQVLEPHGHVRVVEETSPEVLLAPYRTFLENKPRGGRCQRPTLWQYHRVSGGEFIERNIVGIILSSGLTPMYCMRQPVQLCAPASE